MCPHHCPSLLPGGSRHLAHALHAVCCWCSGLTQQCHQLWRMEGRLSAPSYPQLPLLALITGCAHLQSCCPQPTGRRNPQGGRKAAYKTFSPWGCGEVSGEGGGYAGSTRCWQEAAGGCSSVCSSWPLHGMLASSTHQPWLCRGRVVAKGAPCAGFCHLLVCLFFGVEDHRALFSVPPGC